MLPAICRSKLFRPESQNLTFRCEDSIIFFRFRYFDPSLSLEIRPNVFFPFHVTHQLFTHFPRNHGNTVWAFAMDSDVSVKTVSAKTWRRTVRQKNMLKRPRLKTFAETFRIICGAYPVYARSPSPSQRTTSTTIASRSPFPLGLCSCSTSLSKMGT